MRPCLDHGPREALEAVGGFDLGPSGRCAKPMTAGETRPSIPSQPDRVSRDLARARPLARPMLLSLK